MSNLFYLKINTWSQLLNRLKLSLATVGDPKVHDHLRDLATHAGDNLASLLAFHHSDWVSYRARFPKDGSVALKEEDGSVTEAEPRVASMDPLPPVVTHPSWFSGVSERMPVMTLPSWSNRPSKRRPSIKATSAGWEFIRENGGLRELESVSDDDAESP